MSASTGSRLGSKNKEIMIRNGGKEKANHPVKTGTRVDHM